MYTRLCRFLQASRRQPPTHKTRRPSSPAAHARSGGQVIVIFAVSLLVLIFFIGLAIDAGSMYVTYGQLKRAVDAASVSAANDFKKGVNMTGLNASAKQILTLHNVDLNRTSLKVYICDAGDKNGDGNYTGGSDADGNRDAYLQTEIPDFYARCPDTANNEVPKKLVWVEARLNAPFYFLSLLGFNGVDLRTNAISEAAPVDVVIVLDTSESMGVNTPGYVVNDFFPNGSSFPGTNTACNPNMGDPNSMGTCSPLLEAKQAAKALVDHLYNGYDRVAVVTFDQVAYDIPILNTKSVLTDLSDDLDKVDIAINHIKLHDDPSYIRMWGNWQNPGRANLVNPDDMDGVNGDADDPARLGYTCPNFPATDGTNLGPPSDHILDDRWWSVAEGAPNPYGWGGVPCDRNDRLDAYDWDLDGKWTQADSDYSNAWLTNNSPSGISVTLSPLSTCTGCGIRVAADVLKTSGRANSVWVIILLSDGVANLSDTHVTAGQVNGTDRIPTWFPNGFCTGKLFGPCVKDFGVGAEDGSALDGYWCSACQDNFRSNRYCIDQASATCPPGSTWIGDSWNPYNLSKTYSVYDYARDMTDEAALTKSANLQEPAGNDIAIYTIGLGAASQGADLLRYMAAVGASGDRTLDPCAAYANQPTHDCGQYYYADDPSKLIAIFEDIASRIYTRISE